MKAMRVAPELLAMSRMQRAAGREAGAPLYLPAFESLILKAEEHGRDEEEDQFGVAAEGFIPGDDEDDDFY